MTAPRNPDWLIRAFLDEGPMELPDQVCDAVRDRIERTSQRVVIGPWRVPAVNRFLAYGAAAAAVVVAVLIGLQALGGTNVGGPDLTQAPSPTAAPSPARQPSPSAAPAAAVPPAGELAVGRHALTLAGVQLSIEIPTAGWRSNGEFGIDKGNMFGPESAGFIFWTLSAPDNVYSDPCSRIPLSPPAGSSAAELAAAVASVPGTELVSGPSEVTVAGYPAQHVAITVPEGIGCGANEFYLWYDAENPGQARFASQVGSTVYAWIIDVQGTLVWIDGETYATSSPKAEQEVQQIVDSISVP